MAPACAVLTFSGCMHRAGIDARRCMVHACGEVGTCPQQSPPCVQVSGMRQRVACCWVLLLLAATFCQPAAAKGGRGGSRGAARGMARGAARSRHRGLPRYGGALRVAAAAAAAGAAAGAALHQARAETEYHEGNGTAWTSVAPGWVEWGWAMPWLCPLAAILHH